MKVGGLSLYRISVPVIGLTVLATVLSLYVQGYVLPFTNQRAGQVRDQIRGKPARTYAQAQRRWVLGDDGRVYSFRNYTHTGPRFLALAGGGLFQGFSVFRPDRQNFAIRERVYSREASWRDGVWILRDGWRRTFDTEGQVTGFEAFPEKSVALPETPSRFLGDVPTPDQMSYSQLREFIGDLKTRGYSVQELLVDLHEKVALPFVSMVMVVLGLPFAFRTGKKGSLYGIGLSIGLVVLYYSTFAVLSALGQIGFLPPLLAAWAPNVLFLGAGTYLLLTLVKT
jgi:lipopolysaccharide export system permease protein